MTPAVRLAALLALCATACGPQAGDLYALSCTQDMGTGERTVLNNSMFGREGLAVLDERAGKVFLGGHNIAGILTLQDACAAKAASCLLRFSPDGGRGFFEDERDKVELVYDRAALTFTLNAERKTAKGDARFVAASWHCTETEFPSDRVWRARS